MTILLYEFAHIISGFRKTTDFSDQSHEHSSSCELQPRLNRNTQDLDGVRPLIVAELIEKF